MKVKRYVVLNDEAGHRPIYFAGWRGDGLPRIVATLEASEAVQFERARDAYAVLADPHHYFIARMSAFGWRVVPIAVEAGR